MMAQFTAQDVLPLRFIGYPKPLEIARSWARDGNPDLREQALILLQGLYAKYPHSVEIAEELAFVYLEASNDLEARRVLDEIQVILRDPHEELLARRGRIFRDKGDQFVNYPTYTGPPEVRIGGEHNDPVEALRYYRLALAQYAQSYQVRLGHYPGVNVATLDLLIAAFTSDSGERATKRQHCRSTAAELLRRKELWPSEHEDDDLWHAASTGEIHLLQEEWELAEQWYRDAQNHSRCGGVHRASMLKQVIRITHGYRCLGVKKLGPFDDLRDVFPPDSAEEPPLPDASAS